MPVHDWTRVSAGTWHDFHLAWIAEIRLVLNDGLLPPDYYAQAEQVAGPVGPDVLTLQRAGGEASGGDPSLRSGGGLAVVANPPRVKLVAEAEADVYGQKRRTLVIRHSSGDRIVALLEIVSPGNKAGQYAIRSFVDKAVAALTQGYHLLIIDLFPPTSRDPAGLPGAIWSEFSDVEVGLPAEGPLTLSAFAAGPIKRLYLAGTAAGSDLIEMPLFLESEMYVNVPMEATYRAAYRGVPRRWKEVLEA